MVKFRFQGLETCELSSKIADQLSNVAELLEYNKLFRFDEHLRGSALSMSNNIAEGSGYHSKKGFTNS